MKTLLQIIEIIKMIIQPITSVYSFFQKKRLNRKIEISQNDKFINLVGNDFKNKFIVPNLREIYFLMETGIKTNEKSIDKYINFKNYLGKNYTWEQVKLAQSHLDLEGDDIKIKISKIDRISTNIIIGISIILFLVGFFSFICLTNSDIQDIRTTLFSFFVLIFPMIGGYMLMNNVNSTIVARGMEKWINKKINKSDKN